MKRLGQIPLKIMFIYLPYIISLGLDGPDYLKNLSSKSLEKSSFTEGEIGM